MQVWQKGFASVDDALMRLTSSRRLWHSYESWVAEMDVSETGDFYTQYLNSFVDDRKKDLLVVQDFFRGACEVDLLRLPKRSCER
jgi:hypothetical protein